MYSTSYEITALIARYILIFLCAVVLLRTIFISRASRIKNVFDNNVQAAKLIMKDTNKEYILSYDNTIGRSNRCDIQIYGQDVSKIHAQIYKKQNKWMLCVYSKNTTLLNEINVGGRIEINSRDVIRFGNKDFIFVAPREKKI